jgi:hypothetical protein
MSTVSEAVSAIETEDLGTNTMSLRDLPEHSRSGCSDDQAGPGHTYRVQIIGQPAHRILTATR